MAFLRVGSARVLQVEETDFLSSVRDQTKLYSKDSDVDDNCSLEGMSFRERASQKVGPQCPQRRGLTVCRPLMLAALTMRLRVSKGSEKKLSTRTRHHH